MKLFSLEIPL